MNLLQAKPSSVLFPPFTPCPCFGNSSCRGCFVFWIAIYWANLHHQCLQRGQGVSGSVSAVWAAAPQRYFKVNKTLTVTSQRKWVNQVIAERTQTGQALSAELLLNNKGGNTKIQRARRTNLKDIACTFLSADCMIFLANSLLKNKVIKF